MKAKTKKALPKKKQKSELPAFKKNKEEKPDTSEDLISPIPDTNRGFSEELIEGDDPIELEINNEQKMEYSFSSEEGEFEEEIHNTGDLAKENRKLGNRYDYELSMGSGEASQEGNMEREGIYIADRDDIGLGYGDNDYFNEEEEY